MSATLEEFLDLDPIQERSRFRDWSVRWNQAGETDPIYTMIREADLSDSQKMRMMFSHLMVYDLTHSIRLSSVDSVSQYYDTVRSLFETNKVGRDRLDVAQRETNPKSRTFGTQIPKMRAKSPEEWVELAIEGTIKGNTWSESVKSSCLIPTFGPYFGFKMADMIETVFDLPGYVVDDVDDFLTTIPRGALTGFETIRTGQTHSFRRPEEIRIDPALRAFMLEETEYFRLMGMTCHQKSGTRLIGLQEVETFMCDYRKCRKNTLKIGDKVAKLVKGYEANVGNELAEKLGEPIAKMKAHQSSLTAGG